MSCSDITDVKNCMRSGCNWVFDTELSRYVCKDRVKPVREASPLRRSKSPQGYKCEDLDIKECDVSDDCSWFNDRCIPNSYIGTTDDCIICGIKNEEQILYFHKNCEFQGHINCIKKTFEEFGNACPACRYNIDYHPYFGKINELQYEHVRSMMPIIIDDYRQGNDDINNVFNNFIQLMSQDSNIISDILEFIQEEWENGRLQPEGRNIMINFLLQIINDNVNDFDHLAIHNYIFKYLQEQNLRINGSQQWIIDAFLNVNNINSWKNFIRHTNIIENIDPSSLLEDLAPFVTDDMIALIYENLLRIYQVRFSEDMYYEMLSSSSSSFYVNYFFRKYG